MNKRELAEKLLKLAYDMQDVAVSLDYYGGFSEMQQKSVALMNAASCVRGWGLEIIDGES